MSALNYVTSTPFWQTAAMFMNFPRTVIRPRAWYMLPPLLVIAGPPMPTAFLDVRP